MLGILLTILKIIGIILLVLLGLILTVMAVILLVPIRYRGEGAREEKVLSGSVKITWLLHLLSVDISYSSDGTILQVRLFGKILYPKSEKSPKKDKEKKKNPQPKTQEKREKLKAQPKQNEQTVPEQKPFEEKPQEVETVYEPQTSLPKLPKPQKEVVKTSEAKEKDVAQQAQKPKATKSRKDPLAFVKSKFEAFKKKLLTIKEKFLATKANLQKIKNKIDYWKNLLTSEPMKEAIATLWKKAKGLLRHILPRKLTGRVHFGFEDPSMTGKIVAYLSMLYPFTKDNLVIEPEFETEELILEGNLAFRGRIRLGYLVYVVLSVVLNKNIRRQYKRLRQGGKKDGEGRN